VDLLNILPDLESIASSINFGPLNDLLAKIHEIVDRVILFITPDGPVRDGGQALIGYAERFGDLKTRLANSKPQLQAIYGGPAADQYYASFDQSLQIMRQMHDHLNNAAGYHGKLAEHFLEASIQQGMIAVQAGIMAVDLGSLIFTGGLDAPISVPVAAGDAVAAGGSMVAMDAAMTAAETTAEVIGESAADMGEMAFGLGEDGSSALAEGDSLAGDGSMLSDASGEPPPGDTPLDPSANGGDGGGGGPPGDTPPGGDNPLYNNPQQYADARAQQLQQALPEGSRGRVTMGSGVVEDSNGVRQAIVGTSENGGYLRPGVKALLNPDDIVAEGTLHAEQNIVQYATENGLKVIAVGAGRPICEICEEVIVNAGGQDAIASLTRSGFIPFWMRLLGP